MHEAHMASVGAPERSRPNRAALGAALDENSLIGPAFGSMMFNFTPQADFVQVNATYK